MKISGSGSIRSDSVRRRGKKGAAQTAEFNPELEDNASAAPASAVGQASPLAAIDGLLSLQEVPDVADGRSRGLMRGHEMLDVLEGIRRAILLGAIPLHQLRNLADNARNRREVTQDQRLDDILAEIELRAEVELAKFGQ